MKKKYASQILRGATKKNLLLFAVAAFALCVSPAVAVAADCLATTIWTGSISNDWFEPLNWSNGAPNCSREAQINNGGTANIDSTGAVDSTLTLGFDTADSGNLSVDGGSLTNCDDIFFVGNRGKGTLTITNGGTVTGSINASIASLAGELWVSNGTAKVDGTNSTWTVSSEVDVGGTTTGAGGTGLLTVTNSGTVSAASVHVWGSGTLTGNGTVSTTHGTTIDGTITPSGRLTIDGVGGLRLNGDATMTSSVTQQAWDNLYVTGAASLNGRLLVTLTGFFTGDFPLLHASSLTGSFSSVSFTYSGCLSPSIVYDRVNGYVYLHVESSCQ